MAFEHLNKPQIMKAFVAWQEADILAAKAEERLEATEVNRARERHHTRGGDVVFVANVSMGTARTKDGADVRDSYSNTGFNALDEVVAAYVGRDLETTVRAAVLAARSEADGLFEELIRMILQGAILGLDLPPAVKAVANGG